MTRAPRCRITLLGLGILTLLTNPLAAQEPGAGTLTIDGETQSLTVQQCARDSTARGGNMVNASATGDDGSFTFGTSETEMRGVVRQNARIFYHDGSIFVAQRVKTSGAWSSPDETATGPLFEDDGSMVAASGTFIDQATSAEHVIEISVECAG